MPLEKSQENIKTCHICGKYFKNRKGMASHFNRIHHISAKEHYDKFYKLENEIDYHPDGIKYVGKDYQIHYYFPDFYIPKWNLIVEIKSDYIETLDESCYLKEITTRSIGYNYIKILNYNKKTTLNFESFNLFIEKLLL